MPWFVSGIFDSANASHAARLLPNIQKILRTDAPALAKRAMFMDLAQGFIRDDMAPRVKAMIRFAFVETA